MDIAFGVTLLVLAVAIVVLVLFQSGKDKKLSGTIAGGNETFYGKEKGAGADKIWFKWTLVASIVFAVATLLAYVIQPDYDNMASLDYWKSLSEYSSLLK